MASPAKKKTSLLKPVATIDVDGAEQFDASKKFCKGDAVDGVEINYIGQNFKQHLLSKVEDDVPWVQLTVHDLQEDGLDDAILSALAGRSISSTDEVQAAADRVELKLAHLWTLLKAQGDSKRDGPLLVNGHVNIFYIRDTSSTLWAVNASWPACSDGWRVYARPVGHKEAWLAGRRVFSRFMTLRR